MILELPTVLWIALSSPSQCGSKLELTKNDTVQMWEIEVKQWLLCTTGHCWVWGERFQRVPVCSHPAPLHICLSFPNASPCAQWHCRAHHQMHCCGVTKLVASESQRPLFPDPMQELDGLLFKIPCKLWLTSTRALSLSSSLFQTLFPYLFPLLCKVQSLDQILHFIIVIIIQIPWALTNAPLNSGSGILLFRCWCFLVRCPNIRFWLYFTLFFFHGPNGVSVHSPRLLWIYCPGNVIFRYCYLSQAQDFLCFSPSHQGLTKISS